MSDIKFTPGPWSVHNTGDIFTDLGARNAEGIDAPSNDGWHIADCDMGGLCLEEVRANAHLIAAAPDMYEALQQAITSMQDSGYQNSHVVIRAGKAALAKAEGKS
tara:strand:+ start:24 stop:338 length:315 start_codon:yes stop_codon:yes gene_type:complete